MDLKVPQKAVDAVQTVVLTLPWVCAWQMGPIITSTQWLLSGLALSWVMATQVSATSLVHALRLASLMSAGFACVQFFSKDLAFWVGWIAVPAGQDIYANLFQRNLLATLCALGGWVWLSSHSGSEGPQKLNNAEMIMMALALVLIAMANAMTSSRIGALNWIVATLMCFRYARSQQQRGLAVLALVAYFAWVVVLPDIEKAVSRPSQGLAERITDASAYTRWALWANVIELIEQKPGLGHGWGGLAYAHYSAAFSGVRFMEMLDNAHNLPLHLAVELGVPFTVIAFGVLLWWVRCARSWVEQDEGQQVAWGILIIVGIHSLVEYPLWYGPFLLTTVVAISVLYKSRWQSWRLECTVFVQHLIRYTMSLSATALILGLVWVAFDYHRVSQIYLQPEQRSAAYATDPMGVAKKSVFFRNHAKFAELQTTPLSRETAPRVFALASELVRWSPEPRIIEKLIESAVMLGRDDVAAFHIRRLSVAYPAAYAAWSMRQK